jgi:LPXTG-motif cell wall-anchored protein
MKSNRRVSSRKVAGVAAGLVVLTAAQAGSAVAASNADGATAAGDIKIHNVGTSEDDNSNEPKVCTFTLVGDNFGAGESLTYAFRLGEPFKDDPVLTGGLVADSLGSFSTDVISGLTPGHYKVTVVAGEDEEYKVFQVECDPVVVTPPVVTDPPVDPPVDPVDDPDPVTPDDTTDSDGNPDDTTDPEVDTTAQPPADTTTPDTTTPDTTTPDTTTPETEDASHGTPVETPADSVVTGTWEEQSAALPNTGASNTAGIGFAGLLLVGAGFVLRRAVRG